MVTSFYTVLLCLVVFRTAAIRMAKGQHSVSFTPFSTKRNTRYSQQTVRSGAVAPSTGDSSVWIMPSHLFSLKPFLLNIFSQVCITSCHNRNPHYLQYSTSLSFLSSCYLSYSLTLQVSFWLCQQWKETSTSYQGAAACPVFMYFQRNLHISQHRTAALAVLLRVQ